MCVRVCSQHPISPLVGGSSNQVLHISLAVHCNVIFTFFLIYACLIWHGHEAKKKKKKTNKHSQCLYCVTSSVVCTKQPEQRTLGDPSEWLRLSRPSPLYDIEVVSVLALVDDVLLGLHPQLEHGVQHL